MFKSRAGRGGLLIYLPFRPPGAAPAGGEQAHPPFCECKGSAFIVNDQTFCRFFSSAAVFFALSCHQRRPPAERAGEGRQGSNAEREKKRKKHSAASLPPPAPRARFPQRERERRTTPRPRPRGREAERQGEAKRKCQCSSPFTLFTLFTFSGLLVVVSACLRQAPSTRRAPGQ